MKQQLHFRISPLFFVTAWIIGLMSTGTWTQALIYLMAIFISIVVHELGHASAALMFSQSAYIQLTAFGGSTTPIGPRLKKSREFILVLMGPLFGLSLAILFFVLKNSKVPFHPYIALFIDAMVLINFVWTLANLIPVLPLDGGQLMRIVLEAIFGISGRRYACLIGGTIALIAALGFTLITVFIPAIFFFLFAFQNLELYRSLRIVADADEDETSKWKLKEALDLSKKHDDHAIEKLQNIRSESGKGLVFLIASQELAENYLQQKNFQKVLEILEPLEEQLMDSGKVILQQAAYELGYDDRVLKIANRSMMNSPDLELIRYALKSAARKQDRHATLGWLQTAKDCGLKDLTIITSEPDFEKLKSEPAFLQELNDILKS
jgi:stage IV sporulation protein FB